MSSRWSTTLLSAIGLWSITFSWLVSADEYRAKLMVRPPDGTNGIIIWSPKKDTQEPILQENAFTQGKSPFFVRIEGFYLNKDDTLIYRDLPLVLNKNKAFSIDVPIESKVQEFSLISISKQGAVYKVNGQIIANDFEKLKAIRLSNSFEKKWTITPGLGITSLSFRESNTPNLNELALTGRLSIRFSIISKILDSELSAYYNFLILNTNITSYSIQFLGVNLRVGYSLLRKSERWRLKLMGGWYYITSFPTPLTFGVQDIGGPQFYPAIEYHINSHSFLSTYAKYSPIISGLGVLSPLSCEVATGLGYSFLALKKWMRIGVDASYLSLTDGQGNQIFLNTYTLGAGFQF